MFAMKRLLGGCVFVSTLVTTTALAQEVRAPSGTEREPVAAVAPLVTAAATATRVRFVSPGTVVQLRLEVYSEAGQKVFDTELRGGNVLDWYLQNGAGKRLPAGTYATVLTIKSLSGRLSQRVGSVRVTDERAAIEAAGAAAFTMAQQQTIGPVEDNAVLTVLPDSEEAITVVAHDGQDGQVTSTRGALTFRTGDVFAGKEKEQMRISEDGRVGIGTDKPQAKLDVAGDIRSSGSLRLDKGVEFADGTVQTTGLSGRKDEDGNLVPNVGGTGTQNRLAKWTDNAGTLGNSIVVDSGNGLQLTAPANPATDTNLLSTSASSSTIGVIASPVQAFLAGNGPYFAMRGNTYTALANQRGLFSISTGNVANPTGAEGSIVFLTGADQVRMFINPVGNVGVGTNAPAFKLDVAGHINTATEYNIAGSRVLSNAGSFNLFAGEGAGSVNTGGFNSFFGYRAGFANTDGQGNSFFGVQAGRSNTSGGGNSFVGERAGVSNQSGRINTFVGISAGYFNTVGEYNTFIGGFAGESTIGNMNTLIGSKTSAGAGVTRATAIGYKAFVNQSNSLVLGSIFTPGDDEGTEATPDTKVGMGITAPTYKLHIIDPSNAGLRVQTNQAGGKVASFGGNGDFQIDAVGKVGGRFIVKENGNVGIGIEDIDETTYKLEVNGSVAGVGSYQDISDARFKKDIYPLTGALSKVLRLRGVSFDWRREEFPALNFGPSRQLGFVAQEVAEVLPEAVSKDGRGYYRMAYAEVAPILVEAIKEQQQAMEKLRLENNQLKARNSDTVARLAVLETKVKRMAYRRSRRHK